MLTDNKLLNFPQTKKIHQGIFFNITKFFSKIIFLKCICYIDCFCSWSFSSWNNDLYFKIWQVTAESIHILMSFQTNNIVYYMLFRQSKLLKMLHYVFSVHTAQNEASIEKISWWLTCFCFALCALKFKFKTERKPTYL